MTIIKKELVSIIPVELNEASLNLYTLINLYKYDGRVSKFWSLKNDIIVKSHSLELLGKCKKC